MGKLRLSLLAASDLDAIYDYTFDEWGVEQVHIYSGHISKALEEISQNPMIPRSKEREDLAQGCRSYHVQQHYVFYRVRDSRVEVGRVLHGSMQFEDHISEEVF